MHVLAALHHRDRTGEGAYLEMSQYESSVRLMDQELADVLNNGGPGPGRIANRSPWCDPHGIFPAAGDDRWVAIACRDEAERARLAAVIGPEPLEAWTRARTREAIVAALREAGVPVSGVEDVRDHLTGSVTSGQWATFDLPSGITAKAIHQPFTWDGERLPLRRSPLWMEHTYDVLVGELGVDPEQFAALLDARILW
jgi:benzylsuccinate CoA-transferase BbsF subunit